MKNSNINGFDLQHLLLVVHCEKLSLGTSHAKRRIAWSMCGFIHNVGLALPLLMIADCLSAVSGVADSQLD